MSQPGWITDLFASIDAMDADRFASFLAEDAVFRYGSNPPTHGKAAVRDGVAAFFTMFTSLAHTIDAVWSVPGAVFVQGSAHYGRQDGSTVTIPFFNCLKMGGAKISDYLIYIDPTPLAT